MNKKEFIKELHNLYLDDVQTWMNERFEERGIEVEEQSEDQEKAMLRSILKHDSMDYDYLEWAAEGIKECNSTYAEQLKYLSDNQDYCGSGVLSGGCRFDDEEDDIFSRYKKYFTTTIAAEIKEALGK